MKSKLSKGVGYTPILTIKKGDVVMESYTKDAHKALISYIMDQYYENFIEEVHNGYWEHFEGLPADTRLKQLLRYMRTHHRKYIEYCYTKPELQSWIIYHTH